MSPRLFPEELPGDLDWSHEELFPSTATPVVPTENRVLSASLCRCFTGSRVDLAYCFVSFRCEHLNVNGGIGWARVKQDAPLSKQVLIEKRADISAVQVTEFEGA